MAKTLSGSRLPRRARWRLVAPALLMAGVAILSLNLLNASAVTFSTPTDLGDLSASPHQIWGLNLRARPTDGLGYVAGFSGSGFGTIPADALEVLSVDNPHTLLCGGNCDDTGGQAATEKTPRLAFAPNGTGYIAYRWWPDPYYRARLRIFDTNNNFQPSIDMGANFNNSGGGGNLDYPDIAYSNTSNQLYVVGQLGASRDTGPAVFGATSDNGQTFHDFHTLAQLGPYPGDGATLIPNPDVHICVDPHDNIHTVMNYGNPAGDVAVASRINGVWTNTIQVDSQSNYGNVIKYGHAIACGNDGYAYAFWGTPNAHSLGIARYVPGQGWDTAHVIHGVRQGEYMTTVDATVTPDGTVYVVAGYLSGQNPVSTSPGMVMLVSTDHGLTWSGPTTVIPHPTPNTTDSAIKYPSITYSIKNSKLQIGGNFINGRISEYSYATVQTVVIPNAETNVAVNPASFNSLQVVWNNTTTDSGYNIHLERSTDGTNFTDIATLPVSATSYNDTNLGYNTTYYYRLRYINTSNTTYASSYSTVANGKTLPIQYLSVDSAPSLTEPGKTLSPVKITLRDFYGNAITNYSGNAVINVTSGSASALSGTTTIPISNGSATFSDLSFNSIGKFTLTVTINGSFATNINVTSQGKLVFSSQPITTVIGQGQNFTVKLQPLSATDPVNGPVVTNYNGTVVLSLVSGPSGATLTNYVAPMTNGVANFASFSASAIGAGYQVVAAVSTSSDPIQSAYSTSFSVGANVVLSQPTPNPVVAGQPFSLSVNVQNSINQTVPYTGTVWLSVSGGQGGQFYGQTVGTATNGVATFSNLSVFSATTPYSFTARLPYLPNPSSAVTITPTAGSGTCDGLTVNSSATDNGDITGSNCVVTLPGALSRATAGGTIFFAPTLTGGQTITLTSALSVTNGVSLNAGCGSSIVIQGANNLQLGGNQTLSGLTFVGKLVLPKQTVLRCTKIRLS